MRTENASGARDLVRYGLRPIDIFREVHATRASGEQLRLIRRLVPRFRDFVKASGKPTTVRTFSLKSLPYPTDFGLFRAPTYTTPVITLTSRLVVVRWRNEAKAPRTLLFSPSDFELGRKTPFFAKFSDVTPKRLERIAYPSFGTVLDHLGSLGVDPKEVDFLSFDHLHTQDVRRLIGTMRPQRDLSPESPVAPWFPNAKLIVQRAELQLLRDMHPLQKPWYQPWTYDDVRREAIVEIEGDLLLGPGIALMWTPGHTPGNQSLVVHTDTGLWVSSENVVATECMTPEHSKIPGLCGWVKQSGEEIVMNGNTMESRAEQYNSIIQEKLVADPCVRDERFLQFLPSSELTPTLLNPLARPTFSHAGIVHGMLG